MEPRDLGVENTGAKDTFYIKNVTIMNTQAQNPVGNGTQKNKR